MSGTRHPDAQGKPRSHRTCTALLRLHVARAAGEPANQSAALPTSAEGYPASSCFSHLQTSPSPAGPFRSWTSERCAPGIRLVERNVMSAAGTDP